MNDKPGYKTTEFWLSLFTVLVTSIVPLLVFYGVASQEEADLWVKALLPIAGAVAGGFTAGLYSYSRARVKTGN